jgi:hypothetical protein
MQQTGNSREARPGLGAQLALVSTPWPLFDRPSVQLGALKAFLNQRHPDILVDTHHVYLKIALALGYPLYQIISQRSWIAECPNAVLLCPDRMKNVARFWSRKIHEDPLLEPQDFGELCNRIEAASLSIIDKEPRDQYFLLGFRFMMQGYHGGVRHQQRMWEPVRRKLKEWRDFYYGVHRKPGFRPILSYEDGKDFLIIHERRLHDDDMTHRLKGTARAIYLFCETQRPMAEMLAEFPRFSEDQIRAFLCMMVEKRLMFNEGDRYLSLAVPA